MKLIPVWGQSKEYPGFREELKKYGLSWDWEIEVDDNPGQAFTIWKMRGRDPAGREWGNWVNVSDQNLIAFGSIQVTRWVLAELGTKAKNLEIGWSKPLELKVAEAMMEE